MRKLIVTFLAVPLLMLRVAFIYKDESHKRFSNFSGMRAIPTYRVAFQVYPELSSPKVTAAVSNVSRDGEIHPKAIVGGYLK